MGNQHNASVLEKKNEENKREKTSFQDFLRSIPQFRSKALSTPGKLEKNQNSLSVNPSEENKNELTFKKVSSYQEELNHIKGRNE